MVVTLALWFYIGALSWLYGHLFLCGMARVLRLPTALSLSMPVVALVGLAWLSTLAGFLALAMPLGLAATLLLAGPALVLGMAVQSVGETLAGSLTRLRAMHPVVLALGLGLGLVALERTASQVANYDSGLYHAQAIRWLETYGVVPGVANLHGRFAFSPIWFVPSALFSLSFLGLRSFHALTGAAYLLFVLFALGGLQRWWNGGRRPSVVAALLAALIGLELFQEGLSSPGTDVPAALLVWVAGLLFLEKMEDQTLDTLDTRSLAITVLASWAVAVKLSTLPILLLPLYLLARACPRPGRAVLAMAASGMLVLVPSTLYTAVASGYLVYPFPALDVLPVDWKVPPRNAFDDLRWVQSWARMPKQSPDVVLALPLGAWLPGWYARFPALEKLALQATLLLLPLTLLAAVLALRRGERPTARFRDRLVLLGVAALGLAFWFLSAPDARFGWGFLVLLPLLFAASLLQRALRRAPAPALAAAACLALGGLVYTLYLSVPGAFAEVARHALLPADYEIREMRVQQASGFRVYAPRRGDQCFYRFFPCTPYSVRAVELRGKTFAQGFRSNAR